MTLAAPTLPIVKEVHTRFLYPFLFQRGKVPEALDRLIAVSTHPRDNKPGLQVWETVEPEEMYYDELLDHCVDFLFAPEPQNGCTYLKMNPVVANQWFGRAQIYLTGRQEQTLTLTAPVQVELFLSHFGAGVLSLTLNPQPFDAASGLSMQDVLALNYQLAHLHPKPAATLSLPHPMDLPEQWNKIPAATKENIPLPCDPALPLWNRLGRPGTHFQLSELLEGNAQITSTDILDPDSLLYRLKRSQDGISTYLTRFPRVQTILEDAEKCKSPDDKKQRLAVVLNYLLRASKPLPFDGLLVTSRADMQTRHIAPRNRGEARIRYNRALLENAFPDLLQKYQSQHLLSPLECLGLTRVQDRLSVYTVLRFDEEVDFGQEVISAMLAPSLSGMAQIEEPAHAGAPPGVVAVSNAVLNRCHWTAVGLLGATHFVADQTGNIAFNEDRVPRVLNKYFSPYLLSLLQRLALHRLIDEVGDITHDTAQKSLFDIATLREHFLQFEISGYFTQISSREVLHRYYRVCQAGMDIDRSLQSIQRALAEIDAKLSTEHQNNQLAIIAEVQQKLEVLEVIIATVYGGEFGHTLISEGTKTPHYIFVLTGALIGALLGIFILRPATGFLFRQAQHSHRRNPDRDKTP